MASRADYVFGVAYAACRYHGDRNPVPTWSKKEIRQSDQRRVVLHCIAFDCIALMAMLH